MTALRNAMVYLGLAEDDKRYDEYDDQYVDEYDAGHELLEEEHTAAEVTPAPRPHGTGRPRGGGHPDEPHHDDPPQHLQRCPGDR